MDISYVQGVPLLPEPIQGEDSDIEEEDPSTLKRKTLTGPNTEGPSSSKRQKTTTTVNPADLAIQWGVSVETVLEWLQENNQVQQQKKIAKKDSRLIQRT